MVVKINKIYTKTGDDGSTSLVGGSRVSKNHAHIHLSGEIDELNSWVGAIRSLKPGADIDKILAQIQNDLFDIGAEVATPKGSEWPKMCVISDKHVKLLEQAIDNISKDLPEIRSFVLPGGTQLNSFMHITRSVCRRAERSLVNFSNSNKVRQEIFQYINRLSDFMFALARDESRRSASPEFLWIPGAKA